MAMNENRPLLDKSVEPKMPKNKNNENEIKITTLTPEQEDEIIAKVFVINFFIATFAYALFELSDQKLMTLPVASIIFLLIGKLIDEVFMRISEGSDFNPDKITRVLAFSPYFTAVVLFFFLNYSS